MAQQLAHNQQLKNPKYRNWVKAGLGLKYLKEGLETFSDDVVDRQHTYIINAVQQKHNLQIVNCGHCNLRTLQPDHVRNKNRQCPLGQIKCNCMFPGGKITCPNNVCGAIHDEIIINHASNPPAPNWKNTDAQNWCTDAWAVAKCYINAPGYVTKVNANEVDCTGLLHLYINSKYLQGKIQCKITGQDVFTKTRSARNIIYHSNSMEMEDIEVDEYIDNMIAVLEDGRELLYRQESQDAVLKLKELKISSIVISAEDEAVVIKEAFNEIDQKINNLKETIQEGDETVTQKKDEAIHALQKTREQLENRAKEILDNIKKVGSDSKQNIEMELKKALDQIKTAVNVNTVSAENAISKHKEEACTEIGETKDAAMETIKATSESMKTSVERTIFKHKEEACTQMEQTNNDAIETITTASENMKTSAEKDILKHKEEACTKIGQTKNAAIETIKVTNESMKTSVERTILKFKEEACTEIGQTKDDAMETIRTTSESMKTSVEKTLFKHKEETCREMEQTKEDAIGIITKTSENMKTSIEINISKHQEEACTVIEQQKKDAIENITASAENCFQKWILPNRLYTIG